jgi:glutamate-1-semialdehyde 2,1-aminomutase
MFSTLLEGSIVPTNITIHSEMSQAAGSQEFARYALSKQLQSQAHRLIPGGAHTYAKGDDQYPELAPGFIDYGSGCHVWDVDGNEYIEYGMGLRSVTLGHAYAPVVEAAYREMQRGANFTRPAAIEVQAAECLLDMLRGTEMVKFAKNGSDVTTAALKLARAHTGRDLVAICAEQPFFSVDDWFIGSTAMPGGIPDAIRELTVKFHYNDIDSLAALFAAHPDRIACVVMEAETAESPAEGYLQAVVDLCHRQGALFVLDEMITGFRWHNGGAQTLYGITPDLSTFGKGIGNGFAVSALVGKREIMELGGLVHDRERVFLLSTTHGAETHSLAAAMATMRTYREQDVIGHMHRQGERLAMGVRQAAAKLGIADYFQVAGRASNLIFVTRDPDRNRSQPFRTLFMQETIRRGLLMPSFVISFAHSDADVDRTIEAVAEALVVYRRALEDGVEHYLVGRPVKPVFRAKN